MPVSLEVSFLPSASQLPLYLALDRGYYKQRGLDVTITSGKGSSTTVQQIAAGQFNVGQADLTAMALLRAKGAPVEAFMAQYEHTTFGIFGAKGDVTDWPDLSGKKVLVSAGSPETFLLPAALAKKGLDANRVQVLNVPAANKEADYMGGSADAMGTDMAGASPRVDAKRASNHLWFSDVLDVLGYGLFARSDYIQAHPEVVRGIVAGTVAALQAMMQDPQVAREAAEDIIRHNTGSSVFTVDSFAPAWPIYQKFLTPTPGQPLGWQSPDAWRSTIQVLHDYGGLSGDMNPQDFYTNAYVGGQG